MSLIDEQEKVYQDVFSPTQIRQTKSFITRLKCAAEEGILLTVKFGLLFIVILYTVTYLLDIRQMAINGNQAALAINEFQSKGWLPKFPVPVKEEVK